MIGQVDAQIDTARLDDNPAVRSWVSHRIGKNPTFIAPELTTVLLVAHDRSTVFRAVVT